MVLGERPLGLICVIVGLHVSFAFPSGRGERLRLRRSYVRRYIEKSPPQSWGGLVEGNGKARPNDTAVRMKYGIVFGLASSAAAAVGVGVLWHPNDR